jgi:hypothetical protein
MVKLITGVPRQRLAEASTANAGTDQSQKSVLKTLCEMIGYNGVCMEHISELAR